MFPEPKVSMTIAAEQANSNQTVFSAGETHGLGRLEFAHPPGTFALTPASFISLTAIVANAELLHGTGLDWGSGVGCLAVAAARIPTVDLMIGLELSPSNVVVARANAKLNGVADKTRFIVSNAYEPVELADRRALDGYRERVDFIVANPPASEGDDGFEFRRRVMRGATSFLRPGGIVFLNVSFQYGNERLQELTHDAPGFVYEKVLASTEWVPFDLLRADLLANLRDYAAEEVRGGRRYTFQSPSDRELTIDACKALREFEQTGQSPLSRWQTHLFRYQGISS
jgi:methylase of polypeptide subunit release factors